MKSKRVRDDVVDRMAAYIASEIEVLMGGSFPTQGFLGEDLGPPGLLLANGFRGAFVGVKGQDCTLRSTWRGSLST
jgi:hypothetical protein